LFFASLTPIVLSNNAHGNQQKKRKERGFHIVWSCGLFLSEIMRCGNSEAKVPTFDRKSKWELKNKNGLLTSQGYLELKRSQTGIVVFFYFQGISVHKK
jgi:hypothetical protein